jgi:uncharacterized membrane protein (UPF0127 family)
MKRWILPVVALAIVAVIAWPFLFAGGTADVKGRSFSIEHRTAEEGPMSRYSPTRNRSALDPRDAILCSWDRDRYLYFWSDGAKAAFDVAFLDAGGKVLQIGRIRPHAGPDNRDDEGLASRVEARRALFLPEGTTDNVSLTPGDVVSLSPDLTRAKPEPMRTVQLGGRPIRVEICDTVRTRNRGLMHRPKMSKDEGMLFLYPSARTGLSFYMRNTLMSLDIAYFDAGGGLVNAYSATRAENPATQGSGIHAPASGAAQFVLEMPIGWFRDQGLTDEKGKPVKPVSLELTEYLRKRAAKSESQ